MGIKHFLAALAIAAAAAFLMSCTGPKGATGPTGANVLSMTFQDGIFPFADYAGIGDTYIDSANASTVNNGSNLYYVGYVATTSDVYRELIKVDLSALVPANATVVKAYLTLVLAAGSGAISPAIKAYRITQYWILPNTTWNSSGLAPWIPHGGTYDPNPISGSVSVQTGNTYMTFTIDNATVQSWMADPSTNYGLILIDQSENSDGLLYFYNSQSTVDYYRPKFTVYYTVQ